MLSTSDLNSGAKLQLTYKSKVKASLPSRINCSKDTYEVLNKYRDEAKLEFIEQFKALLLNRANQVIGLFDVSSKNAQAFLQDVSRG